MQVIKNIQADCLTMQNNFCEYCGKSFQEKIFGDNTKFVRKINVPVCNCFAEKTKEQEEKREAVLIQNRINKLFALADLGSHFQKKTFDNWIQRDGAEKAYNTCFEFAKNFEKGKGILLIGSPGNGKTHLAAAIVNYLIQNKFLPCIFLNFTEFLLKIEDGYKTDNPKYSLTTIIDTVKTAHLVVINDFGKEKYTEKRLETVFTLIDILCNYEISVIITMNPESHEKLADISEMAAILDRIKKLCCGGMIKNNASSYREYLLMQSRKK